ncbi:hypothetical protein E2C01_098105 [Portunus trituberculatus]|uniref:Uncharacterized protein n=1 Tax=Portunus trituberculatus TaxID=210409 RepID=A0A5B7K6T3_PORTR|nr:hypothetical protein [Portunus trituberculatus]
MSVPIFRAQCVPTWLDDEETGFGDQENHVLLRIIMADVGDKGKYKKKIRKVFNKVCSRVPSVERRWAEVDKTGCLIVDLHAIYHFWREDQLLV